MNDDSSARKNDSPPVKEDLNQSYNGAVNEAYNNEAGNEAANEESKASGSRKMVDNASSTGAST